MGGGPPHTDMFDMKPDAAAEYRGEFKPIKTNVPGIDICELMPGLAKHADKYTIIRSVTTMNKPGDHARAPFYWLTGNPRLPSGTDEYPMYGSAVSKFRPGPADLPTFATLGIIDVHTINTIAPSFLGPAHNPFIFDPVSAKDEMSKMLTPQIELPSLERNADLLKALDGGLRRMDRLDPLIEGLDQYQQTAFNMLRSPKLREAMDLSKEDPKHVERYTQELPGQDALSSRQRQTLPAGPAAGRGWRAGGAFQPGILGLARRELRGRPAADPDVRRGTLDSAG